MAQKVIDQSNESVNVTIEEDIIVGEVLQDDNGMFYEVMSIDGDTVRVKAVEVDEDWGE